MNAVWNRGNKRERIFTDTACCTYSLLILNESGL